MQRVCAGLVLGTCLAVNGAPAAAQRSDCRPCVLLTPVAELSSEAGPIVPSLLQSVFRTTDGHWLVSHRFVTPPQIAIYDTAGQFVELYDKEGQGPGEFERAPSLFSGPNDDVWAASRERLVRFDMRLQHIDTRRLEEPLTASRAVVIPDGLVAINTRRAAPGGGFFTVSLMDTAATVAQGLEQEADAYGATVIAPAVVGGFWTLRTNQLLLRRYSNRGRLVRTLPLLMDFFQPWTGEDVRKTGAVGREGFDIPPRPRHEALIDVGDGQIVVFTRVADAEWAATPSSRSFRPSEQDANQLYDTCVVLVDLRTGKVSWSRRMPEALSAVNGASDLVYATRQDAVGHVVTTIVRVQTLMP